MNYKALVEKYWAGETSLEEEKILKVYFNGDSIEEELQPYAGMFQYLNHSKKQTLEKNLTALLEQKPKLVKPLMVRSSIFQLRKIAAAILIFVIAGVAYQRFHVPSKAETIATYWASKEIKDPKEAFLKTKAALLLVSKKLNNGTEAALQQVVKVQQVGQFIKSPE